MKRLKKHNAVIDTNVLISGLFFGGNPKRVINQIIKRKVIWYISPEVAAEFIAKLSHFTRDDQFIAQSIAFVEYYGVRIISTEHIMICRDKRDNMFLEVAKSASADFLVTGDKDLLSLKTIENTKIVTPKEFLQHK